MAKADSKTCLFRVVGFLVFILIGAAIFTQIEKGKDKDAVTFEDLQRQWTKEYNLSRASITKLLQDYDNMRENGAKPAWSFLNSVYFVLQLVTTIGYGNITPTTASGQLFSIAYAMAGIPLTVLALKSVGKLVNVALVTIIRPLHKTIHSIHCEERSCDFLESGNLCINVICFSLIWIIVTAISAELEPKGSLVSVVYSIFVTYSTVGFGDIIPFENHKYVFMIIVIPGLCSLSSLIDSVVAYAEKGNMASRRCFNLPNCCWLSTSKARIKADGTQRDTEDDDESPCEGERVSNDNTQTK